MKIILEGTPLDLKQVLSDSAAVREATKAELMLEHANKGILAANRNFLIKRPESNLSESERKELLDLRSALKASASQIAIRDAEIERLNNDRVDPIQLSPEQVTKVEELFQSYLKEFDAKPLTFHPRADKDTDIPSERVIRAIFTALATGSQVAAIKVIREVSLIPLMECRSLIHNALRKYGCHVDDNNFPSATCKPLSETEIKELDLQPITIKPHKE